MDTFSVVGYGIAAMLIGFSLLCMYRAQKFFAEAEAIRKGIEKRKADRERRS